MKRVAIIMSEGPDGRYPIRAVPPSTPGSKIGGIMRRLESQNPGFNFYLHTTRFGLPDPGETIFKTVALKDDGIDGIVRETKMPPAKPQGMSLTFSVFNGHVNNADKRARALMMAFHPDMLKEFVDIETKHGGVMGIFNETPTLATMFYAGLVTAYANEDRQLKETI